MRMLILYGILPEVLKSLFSQSILTSFLQPSLHSHSQSSLEDMLQENRNDGTNIYHLK